MAPYEVTAELDGPARGALDTASFVELCEQVLAAEGVEDAGLGLLFAGDELLRRLNREHRELDEPADVLSFPVAPADPDPAPEGGPRYLGDIAVSVETAARQAAGAGLTLDLELRHLVLHGLLHLLDYGHATAEQEAAMREREEAVLGPGIHLAGGDRHEGHDYEGDGHEGYD